MARTMTLGLLDQDERELDRIAVGDAVDAPLAAEAVPGEGRLGLDAFRVSDTDLVTLLRKRVSEVARGLLQVAGNSADEDELALERALGGGEHGA